jgi:hypothetical protein
MKNVKFLSHAIMVFVFFLSCGTDKSSNIVGTWKISEIKTSSDIPAEIKDTYKETMDEMKMTYELVIKADSTFEHSVSGSTNIGKWNLSPDLKTLTLKYDNGENETSDIIELTDSKMVTSIQMNDYKNTFTFEKQKDKK